MIELCVLQPRGACEAHWGGREEPNRTIPRFIVRGTFPHKAYIRVAAMVLGWSCTGASTGIYSYTGTYVHLCQLWSEI